MKNINQLLQICNNPAVPKAANFPLVYLLYSYFIILSTHFRNFIDINFNISEITGLY